MAPAEHAGLQAWLEKWGEKGDHSIADVIPKLRERWHKEIRIGQRGLRERYFAGEVQLEVRIIGGREVGDYGAVFHRAAVPHLSELDVAEIGRSVWTRADADVSNGVADQVQSAVLVDPVEFVDDPEGIFGVCDGATVIRLYALNGLDRLPVYPPQFVQPAPVRGFPGFLLDSAEQVRPQIGSFLEWKDGELRAVFDAGVEGCGSGIGNGQFKRKVIEGRAKVVDRIPSDEGQIGGRWFADLGANDCAVHLGMRLRDEAVSICPEPFIGQLAQIVYVLARPIELLVEAEFADS